MAIVEYASALKQPMLDYDTPRVTFDTPAVRTAFSYQYAFSNPTWQPDPAVDYIPTVSLSPAREGDADRSQKLASGELKLFGCPLFLGGSIPAHAERLQAMGVSPVFLPLPNEEGGVTATVDSYAAIRANSPNAEAAYGLIQYLLNDERQEKKAYPGPYLPAKKAALRKAIEHAEITYEKDGVPMMDDETFTALANAVDNMDTAHLQSVFSYGVLNYGDDLSGLLMDLKSQYLSGMLMLDEFITQATNTLQLYLEE